MELQTGAFRTTRFSSLPWADQLHNVMIIGAGGIGSWLTLSLSRIGHSLITFDGDNIDETNVTGGQLYRSNQVGTNKALAMTTICREFGCINDISAFNEHYTPEMGMYPICITALDDIDARRMVFEEWVRYIKDEHEIIGTDHPEAIYIDGRLNAELFEVLAVKGYHTTQIEDYRQNYLFQKEEAEEVACTTKQTSFAAMGIAAYMTSLLCNHLTNIKLGEDFRELPFYHRTFYPIMNFQNKHGSEVTETLKEELCLEEL